MKVLIFLREDRLTPRGGPLAVGYYLKLERDKAKDSFIEFLPRDDRYEDVHENGRKITSKLPAWVNEIHRGIRRGIRNKKLLNSYEVKGKFDFSDYDIVHFHEISDLYAHLGDLENYQGTVLLTSHSPVPFHQEHYSGISGIEKVVFRNTYKNVEKLDVRAFERADYIIFPCEEAKEPYFDNWPYFYSIEELKKERFKYVLTGIPEAKAAVSREEIRKKLNIDNSDFVISYVGRHNIVKGYKRLLEIGKKALDKWTDVQVLVCGKETPLKGLKHNRWKEVGWTTDPHSYISAADVFVLPNTATYFDIVMLEVLSLGKIVVASRTGGNKWFEKEKCPGVFLFDNEEEAVDILGKIKSLSKDEKLELESQNKAFYNKYLSSEQMYVQYKKVLQDIYECEKR